MGNASVAITGRNWIENVLGRKKQNIHAHKGFQVQLAVFLAKLLVHTRKKIAFESAGTLSFYWGTLNFDGETLFLNGGRVPPFLLQFKYTDLPAFKLSVG